MTRDPVRAAPRRNGLPFPLNIRLVMFGWNLLFLRPGPYRPDPARNDAWNRGAYLAEGLGHCGACHTPRNVLGAETGQKFAGGEAEGWTAYALNASSPAAVPWTAETLAHYLHQGFAPTHGVARGPMADVTADLRTVPQQDVQAIASYIAAQAGVARAPAPEVQQQIGVETQRGKATAPQTADSQADVAAQQTNNNGQGAEIYAAACAGCHQGPRAMPYGGIDLALSSGITGPSARNLVNVVLYGLPAAEGAANPIMPGFAAALSDQQLVALAAYLRQHFSDRQAWRDIDKTVQDARSAARAGSVRPAPSEQTAPPTSQRTSDNAASH
jgi:mono/diheme cytochrome c family protein